MLETTHINTQRRTKIIATIGPASEAPEVLRELIIAGVNLVRINMSHGTVERHNNVINHVRNIAQDLNVEVGVLLDLQGPKIRIAKFKEGVVDLIVGNKFILDAGLEDDAGDEHRVGLDYKNLAKDLHNGDRLLLDDGRIVMDVVAIKGKEIHCVVQLGGKLSNNKGINRQGGGLSAEALTAKDKQDILFAAQCAVDYVAISFPRSSADMEYARRLLTEAGSDAWLVSKIERAEAIESLEEIIEASDAVMVARGDLGVEMGFAELPALQKRIIRMSLNKNKPVITATQMMESMNYNVIPTRAEVSDVANAVLEGTDAVMLSAETASGLYPVQAVEAMAEVCLAAERQLETKFLQQQNLERNFSRVDEAIAMAAMYTASHLEVKAIVALTENGVTPLLMSRIRTGIPVYGISKSKLARGRMTLYRGVYPIDFDISVFKRWEIIRAVLTELRDHGFVQAGERVIVTRGDMVGQIVITNSLKIVTVEPAGMGA
jgi:pyruvate kinase